MRRNAYKIFPRKDHYKAQIQLGCSVVAHDGTTGDVLWTKWRISISFGVENFLKWLRDCEPLGKDCVAQFTLLTHGVAASEWFVMIQTLQAAVRTAILRDSASERKYKNPYSPKWTVSSERAPHIHRTATSRQTVIPGHTSQRGLDTKTYWLTDLQS
jgi:hypothetical protein